MSEFLLDTHILLWSLLRPERLSSAVARELDASDNSLWLSPITTWEVIILAEKGRIELDRDPGEWMKRVFDTFPFSQAALNHEVAIESRKVALPHQDPADRFIAASAVVYGLTLITADAHLISASGNFSVLPNR
jgi:PIN domain nuclease of toxin-antitoxin system